MPGADIAAARQTDRSGRVGGAYRQPVAVRCRGTRAAPGFTNNAGVFVPQNPDQSMFILEASMWW